MAIRTRYFDIEVLKSLYFYLKIQKFCSTLLALIVTLNRLPGRQINTVDIWVKVLVRALHYFLVGNLTKIHKFAQKLHTVTLIIFCSISYRFTVSQK